MLFLYSLFIQFERRYEQSRIELPGLSGRPYIQTARHDGRK